MAQSAQGIAFAGLRATSGKGQFSSVQINSAGDLYLLLNQGDGVRILKTDASASQVFAQAQLGAAGDIGIAMALDPAGNVYITGTTTSGAISGTSGVVFPSRADFSTNSFVAKFDSSLNPLFVTYAGSGRTAASGIAATADAVFITGSIFAATLPVTTSAIMQQPAAGTTGNGFVERFNSTGSALTYASYLTGFGGDTSPTAIVADASDSAYIAGYTNAPGYPTTTALVPVIIGSGSGFLTKLQPAGDGINFSTFIPGDGITSLALDSTNQNLLLSGSISLGAFPVSSVSSPLVSTTYQTAVRMPLDGRALLASTLLAPGTQSILTSSPNGAWATLPLDTPLLPIPAISSTGNTAALHINPQSAVDQAIRMGGPGLGFTQTVPVTISSIAIDSSDQPLFAGAATSVTSASQLPTATFDLSLVNSPTTALPSTLHDAVLPAGTNCGSLCTGSGAYLSKLSLTAAPTLAFSVDAAPNIRLRNLGSLSANNLVLSASGYTLSHNCPAQLAAGAECNILLTGAGSGSIIATSDNASQTVSIPTSTRAATPLVFSPAEVDFGIITAPGTTRTVTVTNLDSAAQPVPFYPNSAPATGANPFTLTTDCPNPTSTTAIQPGASCHLVFAAALPSSIASGLSVSARWTTGTSSIVATAYLDPQPLNISAPQIDFGTQYLNADSLKLPRYLYLSNNGTRAIQHTRIILPSNSVFTIADRCPSMLEPHTVCQVKIDYLSSVVSSDSITLSLDQGLSALITGRTISEPGSGGASVNPSLAVSPSSITFANSVTVTTTSSASQSVSISNTGSVSFPLSLAVSGDFVQSTNCPTVLTGGSRCSVALSFAPSQSGTRQGLLTISSGSGSMPSYVTLTGTGADILSSNNGSLDLGSTVIGQPTVLWTKITQPFSQLTATTSGNFSVALVEDIGYGHGQPSSSSFTPAATGSCANCWLGVQFLPASAGLTTETLSLPPPAATPTCLRSQAPGSLSPASFLRQHSRTSARSQSTVQARQHSSLLPTSPRLPQISQPQSSAATSPSQAHPLAAQPAPAVPSSQPEPPASFRLSLHPQQLAPRPESSASRRRPLRPRQHSPPTASPILESPSIPRPSSSATSPAPPQHSRLSSSPTRASTTFRSARLSPTPPPSRPSPAAPLLPPAQTAQSPSPTRHPPPQLRQHSQSP
jgi:hypothetical protein